MRPNFVLGLCLSAFVILGAAFFLKQYLGSAPMPPAAPAAVAPAVPVASKAVANIPPETAPPSFPVAPVPTNTLTPEQRQTAIEAETDRLQQWSMNDDPASLSNILADLTNPEKKIREAATDATKQFGSTNAIPALKAAVEMTDDPQEKAAYLEAADFLSLPSMDINGSSVLEPPE